MWFKNLLIFRFTQSPRFTADSLQDELTKQPFIPCGERDLQAIGWIPPLAEGSVFTHVANQCVLFTLRTQEKILPSYVIREFMAEKIKTIEMREQRKIRKGEKNSIRDEVLQELIPRAFTKTTDLNAYIDMQQGWLLVNTASLNKAQALTHLLRRTIGDLPIVTPRLNQAIPTLLTSWLNEHRFPHGFNAADACQMTDTEQAVVSCRRQDLLTQEVHAHIDAGKQVTRLALEWENTLQFSVDEELVLRNIKFLNVETEKSEDSGETEAQQLDADFTLMALTFRQFIPQLFAIFGGEDEAAYRE